MNDINVLIEKLKQFRDERDWLQFHTPKDLAISVVLEATEVLEHFQWKTPSEVDEYVAAHRGEIADELGDVLKYLLGLSDVLGIDLVEAALNKLEKDALKYPVEKAKGKHTKYNQL